MTQIDYIYLYLLSPLHTGGTTQEGNLVGIAREVHTQLPYIPSSTIRGRLRANITDEDLRTQLFGPELNSATNDTEAEETPSASQLEQGDIWIGDASLLWFPISSLSHGIVWISCPRLIQRWARFQPKENLKKSVSGLLKQKDDKPCCRTNLVTKDNKDKKAIYLKDAIIKKNLKPWKQWQDFVPQVGEAKHIDRVLLLPDNHFATLVSMSLWRQVRINLDEHKSVKGGFRYEEAIPPETLVYFPWGITAQVQSVKKGEGLKKRQELAKQYPKIQITSNFSATEIIKDLFEMSLGETNIMQIGGQESLGRGFVEQYLAKEWVKEEK